MLVLHGGFSGSLRRMRRSQLSEDTPTSAAGSRETRRNGQVQTCQDDPLIFLLLVNPTLTEEGKDVHQQGSRLLWRELGTRSQNNQGKETTSSSKDLFKKKKKGRRNPTDIEERE